MNAYYTYKYIHSHDFCLKLSRLQNVFKFKSGKEMIVNGLKTILMFILKKYSFWWAKFLVREIQNLDFENLNRSQDYQKIQDWITKKFWLRLKKFGLMKNLRLSIFHSSLQFNKIYSLKNVKG